MGGGSLTGHQNPSSKLATNDTDLNPDLESVLSVVPDAGDDCRAGGTATFVRDVYLPDQITVTFDE